MSHYVIIPRDPLVMTDGRGSGMGQLRSLAFPWPSSLAGLVRTRIGSDTNGHFIDGNPELLKSVEVRGPWLVRWGQQTEDSPAELFFPAPRDCVWMRSEPQASASRYRLGPTEMPPGCSSNLQSDLTLVGPLSPLPDGKPWTEAPLYWSLSELHSWLVSPSKVAQPDTQTSFLAPLPKETRTHVAITPGGATALDGMLFSTQGVRFAAGREARFGIGFACEDSRLAARRSGPVVLGGERRVASLHPSDLPLPEVPDELLRSTSRQFRVVLLTPGYFKERGFAPTTIAGAPVTAAVVGRPEVVSGWDYAFAHKDGKRGAPKPTRRLAPAGSVYWVTLPESLDLRTWLKEVWMRCISDDIQHQRDGFGLAVIGVA